MKTLSANADRQEVLARLNSLTEKDTALWGSMSVHQMVCHLNDSYQLPLGLKSASPASGFLQRTLLKWIALNSPMRWPHGVSTRPEVAQGKGGTPPVDFTLDRDALLATFQQFCEKLPEPSPAHPIFSRMTKADWMRWGYLHADHHLRQFNR